VKSLRAIQVSTAACLALLPAAGQAQADQSRSQQIYERCKQELAAPRFAPLYRKMVSLFESPSSYPTHINEKPTAAEKSLLAGLYEIFERCQWDLAASMGLPERSSSYESVDLLFLLREGRITFGEYNRRRQEEALNIDARVEKAAREQQSSSFYLSCASDSPASMRGVEFTYLIDPRASKVTPNRGAVPERTSVTDAEIWYSFRNDDNSTGSVRISRLSGRFDITGDGVGLLTAGQCTRSTKALF